MPRYPLATIAAYGPDNTFATKLVVSILERDRQREPPAMRTWTTVAVDVRSDPTIAAAKPKPKPTRCNELTIFQPIP